MARHPAARGEARTTYPEQNRPMAKANLLNARTADYRELTRQVAGHAVDEWTPDRLDVRQAALAASTVHRWRADFAQ